MIKPVYDNMQGGAQIGEAETRGQVAELYAEYRHMPLPRATVLTQRDCVEGPKGFYFVEHGPVDELMKQVHRIKKGD